MIPEEKFWRLVSRKLAGEASPDDLHELERLLSVDKELAVIYTQLAEGRPGATESDQLNAEQSYATHFVKMQLDRQFEMPSCVKGGEMRRRRGQYRTAIVSSACILVLAAGLFFLMKPGKNIQSIPSFGRQKYFVAKKGAKSRIRLTDGTTVLLNGDSRIACITDFQGATREVELSGEAFFDVVKDKTRPFTIHTASIDLNVLGTSFNVRSYSNEKNTETSLLSGSVEVTLRNSPDKKIILKPSEKLLVRNGMEPTWVLNQEGKRKERPLPILSMTKVRFDEDSSALETSWTRNSLEFDEEDLDVIARKIERWYDVVVVIKNEGLKKRKFTGIFENKPLHQVVEALQLSRHFNYTLQDKELIIY
jgi:transmembrane sensor